MASTLHVSPVGHRGKVTFTLPVKGVFGRVLCDTDGTIGYPTEFSPETALQIVEECDRLPDKLWPGDKKKLRKVRMWAERGYRMFADWIH